MTKLISFLTFMGAYGWCPLCSTPFGRKRSVGSENGVDLPPDLEHLLAYIVGNDHQLCVARVVCEIHAKTNRRNYGIIERNIVDLFNSLNSVSLRQETNATVFKYAASLGIASTNIDTCQEVYHTCRLDRHDLNRAVEAANILNQ